MLGRPKVPSRLQLSRSGMAEVQKGPRFFDKCPACQAMTACFSSWPSPSSSGSGSFHRPCSYR